MPHIPRLMLSIISILLTALIIIVSILLILIILVQRPKQEGLGAAFGGGAFDSALGAHTTDVLQKITTWLAVIFFVSAIGLAMTKARQFAASPVNNALEKVDAKENAPVLPPSISDLPSEEGTTTTPSLLDGLTFDKPAEGETGTPKGEAPPAPDAPKGEEKGKAKAPEDAKGKAEAKGDVDAAKAKGDDNAKGKGKGEQ